MREFWRDLQVGLGGEGCWQVMRRWGGYRLRSALPRSPHPPYPGSSRCPSKLPGPRARRGALPTVLPVIKLLLLPHPCGRPARRRPPAPAAAPPLPSGPDARASQGEAPRDRLAAAPPSKEPGGTAQTGQTGPSGAAASDRLDPETEEGRERGRRERGGAAAAPATHRRPI